MKNNKNYVAIMYCIIHALVELVCFTLLYDKFGLGLTFVMAVIYDFFAFVPQAIIGQLNNSFKRLDIGTLGTVFMAISIWVIHTRKPSWVMMGIVLLGIGNAMLHEAGAIATVTVSKGTLFPSALFVAGGSFGLIIGQTLGKYGFNTYYLLIVMVIIEVLVLLTNRYWLREEVNYPKFELTKDIGNEWVIIGVAFAVTTVRSYIGYAIPISWNKTIWQAFALYFVMGAGKAVGGYLADKYGARKTGILSTIVCIPFLIIGNNIMLISIVGVFLFSCTMSITFGMLLSVIKDNPGLAFGVTTLGLFLGVLPALLGGTFGLIINSVLVIVLSLGSAYGLYKTLR